MYIYHYKNVNYRSYYDLIKRHEFQNVSFPCEELVTDEILAKFGITREVYTPPTPTLEEVKASKTQSLTSSRDAEEYHNVTTDIGVFEFDTLSQTRLTNAMNSMGDMQTREWTTADHTIVTMYKTDFQNIFKVAAVRSDENFAKLKRLKSLVNNATTVEEVNAIRWEEV